MLSYLSLITPEHISINDRICKIELPLEVQVELGTYLVAELERGVLAFDDLSPVEYKNGSFKLFGLDLTPYFNNEELLRMLQDLVDEDDDYISTEDEEIVRITASGNKVFASQEIEDDYLYLYKTEMEKGNLETAKAIRATILECNMGLVKQQIKK